MKLAVALADPFNALARGVGGANGVPGLTQKVTSITRFTGYVGTSGYGFCTVHPTLSNDLPIAFYTGPGFVGNTAGQIQVLKAANTPQDGVTLANQNSPYASGALTTGITAGTETIVGRILSVGVRAVYTGTTTSQSGLLMCLTDPNHGNIICGPGSGTGAGANLTDIFSNPLLEAKAVDREWCQLTLYPAFQYEREFSNSNTMTANYSVAYPWSNGTAVLPSTTTGFSYAVSSINTGSAVGLIYFQGVPGQTFQFEIVQHMEFSGSIAERYGTETRADVEGAQLVYAAASKLLQMRQASPHASNWDLMKLALIETASAAAQYAVPSTIAAIAKLLI